MSIAAQLAQQSKLYIAGSPAAAEDLTAIALGNPTILTITGHDGVVNGDVVALADFAGADAAELNGESFTVTHYATGTTNDTFAIDYDSTLKTITIGTATATPSAWIQMTEMKSLKPAGAAATKIDVSDLDSTAKEYRTGLVDNGEFTTEIHILETDAGQAAVLAAFLASTTNNYKVTTSAKTRTFNGTCLSFPTVPDVTVDGVQMGTANFQINGDVTVS